MGSDDARSTQPLHVVIFPWLAFGHLIPTHDLAVRLASRGHRVSFVSTPRNIARLPLAPLVDMVALPLPRVDGLPDGAESTNDVTPDMFGLLQKACDGLAAPFLEFFDAACAETKKPDLVIFDGLLWVADAAVQRKVPHALFLVCAAKFAVDQWDVGSGQGRTLPGFEKAMRNWFVPTAERVTLAIERCDFVLMRSCLELEPVAAAGTLHGKPVVPLGLLPPSPAGGGRCKTTGRDDGDDAILRWLDAQPAKSVVYVALGSEVPLRVEDVHELALGLELAGTPFIWALRWPIGVAPDADILPPGFEERTRSRGLIATGWMPQVSVLAHGSVAAFLTHCGWSSIIEGLFFGHPFVMLPMYFGQVSNARLVEGAKAGVMVPRDEHDGSFHRNGVAAAVRAVAVDEASRTEFAAVAQKLQKMVTDRECHEKYIDRFVQQVRDLTAME